MTTHLINALDLSFEEQDKLLRIANHITASPKEYSHFLKGRIMASLFFEPSARARFNFETAIPHVFHLQNEQKHIYRCTYGEDHVQGIEI